MIAEEADCVNVSKADQNRRAKSHVRFDFECEREYNHAQNSMGAV